MTKSGGASPDFEAEGLLEGLSGTAREGRLRLLERLYQEGVSLEDLRRAVQEDRLAILPAERVLAVEANYTAREVAQQASIELNVFLAQQRAAGLSIPTEDERAYSDADVAAARRLRDAFEAGLTREAMLKGARVFGQVTSQAAAAARALVGESFIKPGDTELELALRYEAAARTLHPQTVRTLEYLYDAHLREQLRGAAIAAADLAAGHVAGTREVSVCFADLVGFTRLGEEVASEDLGEIADRLSMLAQEAAQHPVSLVKTIGDAAMLVSAEAEALLESALWLVRAAENEGEGFPLLKAGVALGEALNRWGDWYGSPVNLASRVTAIARPSSVLATRDVRRSAGDRFAWSFAGRRLLKGMREEVALYRCRLPEDVPRRG